jgi:hypothetical protein
MLSFRVLLFLACSLASAQITQPSSGGGDLGVFSYSASNLTLTANTYFFSPGGGAAPSTTETSVDYASPVSATIQNFFVQQSAAIGAGNTAVYTWRDNATDQVLTCTIAGASATSCNDITHTFQVTQGDLLTVKLVTTGTIAAAPTVVFGAELAKSTSAPSTPTISAKGFNTCGAVECPGSPPAQAVTVTATAGTVIVFSVSSCGVDSSCTSSVAGTIASVTLAGNTVVGPDLVCDLANTQVGVSVYHVQSYSGGSNSLAVTYTSGAGWYGAIAWQAWTGLAASSVYDTGGCGGASTTSPTATTSGNLSSSNELLYGFVGGASGVAVAGGQTLQNQIVAGEIDASNVAGTGGSTATATFTQSNARANSVIAAFKHH